MPKNPLHTGQVVFPTGGTEPLMKLADGTTLIDKDGDIVGDIDAALASGNIFVGSASGVADEVAMSGDATMAAGGALSVTSVDDAVWQRTATSVTATADGLTTGLIAAGTAAVSVTSDDANKIITLPTISGADNITIVTGGTGCELRTPASSNVQINGVDSDGTNELALASGSVFTLVATGPANWVAYGWSGAGAAIATLVPDAA